LVVRDVAVRAAAALVATVALVANGVKAAATAARLVARSRAAAARFSSKNRSVLLPSASDRCSASEAIISSARMRCTRTRSFSASSFATFCRARFVPLLLIPPSPSSSAPNPCLAAFASAAAAVAAAFVDSEFSCASRRVFAFEGFRIRV
jgi:hypothetical protein